MKKVSKLIGIIALAAVIGFAFTSCSRGSDGGSRGGGTVNVGGVSVRIGPATPSTDFNYRLMEDGQGIRIIQYTGDGGAVVIPAEIEGFPVVELGNNAFQGESQNGEWLHGYNITSVIIPASVKKLAHGCFFRIEKLISVTILGSGVEIGNMAFAHNLNLSEFNMPDGDNVLIPIDGNHFRGCTKLPLATRARLVSMGFAEP